MEGNPRVRIIKPSFAPSQVLPLPEAFLILSAFPKVAGSPPYSPRASMAPPVMMIFSSASGIKIFQPNSISWS